MIAVIILIPVGIYNLAGFADTVFKWGVFRDFDYNSPFVSGVTHENSENSEYSEFSDISEDLLSSDISSAIEESKESETSNISNNSERLNQETNKNENRKNRIKIMDAVFNALFIFGSLCFHYFFYDSARKLCVKTGATKTGFKASRNMIINIVFFSVWGFLTAGGANVAVLNIVTALHFAIIILNFIYIYSCYTTFTFESDDEDENYDEN
jgi:hypothetical protein